ncbi:MAG TPA: HAD family phosphatase [Methylomirabilota bacterium]|nr:HAD family phosphatase [Methylomirabilota bacterium]
MTRPAGLVLDYGNVLTLPQDETFMADAARRLGVEPDAFREAYWRHRHAYDAGLPAAAYWRRVVADVRPGGPTLDDPAWLIAADVASWTIYHEAVWSVAAAFRAAGGRTALLSNSGPEVMARVRAERDLEARFDAVIVSCEVGLAKPDPAIFHLCLDRLRLPARSVLFVDDRADNIEGAARVGLRTLHFDAPGAVDRLRAALGQAAGRSHVPQAGKSPSGHGPGTSGATFAGDP